MASSSNDPDSLVTLHFHDFRVERMRHWWTLLGEDDHADIVGIFGKFPFLMQLRVDHGLLEALASFWDPTHCCFSIGEVDLVPTLEEYAGLLQLDSPFSETPIIPIQGPRSNRGLEKYLVELARDFIAGKRGWKKFRINAFKIAFAGDRERGLPMFCSQLLQLWFCSHLQHFYRLQTPYHFERYTVKQTVKIALPFTGNSRDWALYLLDLPLSGWAWKVTWGPAVWMPWTHCALFDGVPLPGVWGCTGYYPSLALRQFGGVQYPPRLGDLDAVTFDYIPSEDMWRLLFRIEDIWGGHLSEIVLIEDGLPYGQVHRILWCLALFGLQLLLVNPERVAILERELEEARAELVVPTPSPGHLRERSLRLVWSPCGAPCITTVWRWRIFVATWRFREGMSLVDPSTVRPHDIVALRRALDESEAALTSARTSIGAMRVQISVLQGDNGVLQAELDLVHDALDFDASWLKARAVLEEHDEGDPALSTAFGEILQRDLHTSWSLVSVLQVAVSSQ
uniref:DUF7745 domain-containing protein n=1 Tax=Fagus sylvatica TaxID=28930 RepID=A0A2N9HVC6_FAGSY